MTSHPRTPPTAAPPVPSESHGPAEADQETHRHGHWREDKIGLLMTMTSEASNHDPCPMVPETFVNPLGIPKLVREIKRGVPAGEDGVAERAEDDPTSDLEECAEYIAPKVLVKSMVGSRVEGKRFGAILAAAAFARGFFGARGRRMWRMEPKSIGRSSGNGSVISCRSSISSTR